MTPDDRVTAFLAELDLSSIGDLTVLALPEPGAEERAALLERVRQAAAAAEPLRTAAMDAARTAVRDLLLRRFAGAGLEPTFAGLNWTGRPRVDDRVRLIVAAEDAAVAALLEDVLEPDDAAALREPFMLAASMPGTATTGTPDLRGAPALAPIAVGTMVVGIGSLGAIAAAASILRRIRRRGSAG